MKQKRITQLYFGLYLLLLTWIILFKLATDLNFLTGYRHLNLIPFGESVIVNGRIDFSEIIYNCLVFVPFGLLVKTLKPTWSVVKITGLAALLSFSFELCQYIFGIGASDITDLIMNTLGGWLGAFLYTLLAKWFKEKAQSIINIAIGCGLLLFFGLLILLLLAN